MKEVTYEEWQKNPNPRMMWVWDDDAKHKNKAEVVYCCDVAKVKYPIVALSEGIKEGSQCVQVYKHCAEIEEPEPEPEPEPKTRRMTHKELSRWLRENPTREFMDSKGGELIFCHHSYYEDEASKEVPGAFLIREDDGAWREPLVEVKE